MRAALALFALGLSVLFTGSAQGLPEYAPLVRNETVAADSYLYYELDGGQGRQYDFLLDASAPLDVFLLTYSEFQSFKGGRAFYSEFRAVAETHLRRTCPLKSQTPTIW